VVSARPIVEFIFHRTSANASGKLPLADGELTTPAAVTEAGNWKLSSWVHAVVPLRFSRGDARYLLLGPRDGGRRYLSEDFAVLIRLGAAVVEQVEQLRGIQMQNLVSQADLKALQAQINTGCPPEKFATGRLGDRFKLGNIVTSADACCH
jgi:hypothetical protein